MLSDPAVDGAAQIPCSARFALRAATAQAHARLDALLTTLDLGRRDDYARFLTAHAAAYVPVEDSLFMAGADALMPGWAARRRAPALLDDLAALGVITPDPQPSPVFESEAAVLGGLYVLEGSRLGGAMLARTVGADLPTAFLTPTTGSDWRAITTLLDQKLIRPAALDKAAAAATAVFTAFESCARATLEPTVRAE